VGTSWRALLRRREAIKGSARGVTKVKKWISQRTWGIPCATSGRSANKERRSLIGLSFGGGSENGGGLALARFDTGFLSAELGLKWYNTKLGKGKGKGTSVGFIRKL